MLEGRPALESALGESRAKLVAVPGSVVHVQAPLPPVLVNGRSLAKNSPCVLPASACVLWPSWRVPRSGGGIDGPCSYGLTRAWICAPVLAWVSGAAGVSQLGKAGSSVRPVDPLRTGKSLSMALLGGTQPLPSRVGSILFSACILALCREVFFTSIPLLPWAPQVCLYH